MFKMELQESHFFKMTFYRGSQINYNKGYLDGAVCRVAKVA